MREVPALKQIREEYKTKNVEIVAINIAPQIPLERWQGFLEQLELKNVVYAQDTNQEVIRSYRVRTPGTTIVLNKEGIETYRDVSASTYDQLKTALQAAL